MWENTAVDFTVKRGEIHFSLCGMVNQNGEFRRGSSLKGRLLRCKEIHCTGEEIHCAGESPL